MRKSNLKIISVSGKLELCYDGVNKKAKEYSSELSKEIKKQDAFEIPIPVLGGDGTMLEARDAIITDKPFFGLNFGHRGFMMNDVKDPSEVVYLLKRGKYDVQNFPLLIAMISEKRIRAMNDIYFNRITGRNCIFSIKVNDVLISERMSGDGFIISTALGSSAYNVAAGGSAIYAKLPVVSVTPIVVHTPIQIKPMIFPIDSTIQIELLNHDVNSVRGWYDGMDLPAFRDITIKGGEFYVSLGFWKGEDFTKRMVTKIMKIPEV